MQLPEPQTLAVAWSPRAVRDRWASAFALDAALGDALRQASEPLVAQLRLAWWRDRLGEPPGQWPTGNPVLDAVAAAWGNDARQLHPLPDAWERLIGEAPLSDVELALYAEERASGFSGLTGDGRIGCRWALADLAGRTSHAEERSSAKALIEGLPRPSGRERNARPLRVLDALGERSLRRDPAVMLARRTDALVALRLGFLGR